MQHTVSTAEARTQLDQAAGNDLTSHRDRSALAGVTAGVPLAMAALLLAIRVADGSTLALILAMALYGGVIVALVLTAQRARTVPRGFARTYVIAMVTSTVLYTVGVALVTSTTLAWTWIALLAVATAAPGIAGGLLIRGRR